MKSRLKTNSREGYVGLPGCGKSELMSRHAMALLAEGYTVILNDPNGDTSPALHDGTKVPLYHPPMLSADMEIESRKPRKDPPPEAFHLAAHLGRGVINVSRADVSTLVWVARASVILSRGWLEKGGTFRYDPRGDLETPVALLVDELSSWDDASSSHLGPMAKNLLTQSRHHGVALRWCTQFTRLCHYAFFSQSTKLWLFRQDERGDLDRLRDGQVPENVVSALPELPPYTYLEFRRAERKALLHRPSQPTEAK